MYMKYKVRIPDSEKGISIKTIRGISYVYYTYAYIYSPEKKHTVPKDTSIGKVIPDEPDMMYPNDRYLLYFPEADIPDELDESERSGCLSVGAFIIIRTILAEYHLDEMIDRIVGVDSGLFLDLAAYSIIEENNAGQYYLDYAFRHPLFTDGMKVYSDSKVSSFMNSLSRDQSQDFLNEWNAKQDHREKIYISYDSTNRSCSAGDIDLAEFGHPKVDDGKPVINQSVAFDHNNAVPLFYEEYPGSIVDVSQLQLMLEKAKGYGYKHIGFILDRGYFSKGNIQYMDSCGYSFIIMMKGMKKLVKQLVIHNKGTFEDKRENSIKGHNVHGITVPGHLYDSDDRIRYFHIFYDDFKKSGEKARIEDRIDRYADYLDRHEGTHVNLKEHFKKYFDLVYYHEGKEDEKFMCYTEKYDVIDDEIDLCGYFVIITSEKMTAAQALDLYKSRDTSEKLFRADKSYLGNKSYRSHNRVSLDSKLFVEFVALIIRNRIYTQLKDHAVKEGRKNFLTVPAAIKELEKIEITRQTDHNYRLDHAVTKTQKEILKAFGLTADDIRTQAIEINKDIQSLTAKEAS